MLSHSALRIFDPFFDAVTLLLFFSIWLQRRPGELKLKGKF
jgi:hypothetical protein